MRGKKRLDSPGGCSSRATTSAQSLAGYYVSPPGECRAARTTHVSCQTPRTGIRHPEGRRRPRPSPERRGGGGAGGGGRGEGDGRPRRGPGGGGGGGGGRGEEGLEGPVLSARRCCAGPRTRTRS